MARELLALELERTASTDDSVSSENLEEEKAS